MFWLFSVHGREAEATKGLRAGCRAHPSGAEATPASEGGRSRLRSQRRDLDPIPLHQSLSLTHRRTPHPPVSLCRRHPRRPKPVTHAPCGLG